MHSALPLRKILFFAVVVCAVMFLSYLIDDNLEMGWPTNVVRNWQEYGLLNLHGKLVTSPGGYEVREHPEIYYGMSPLFLYPVYFAAKIFGWTGLGTLSFHILLLLVVLWASWNLAGRDNFAVIAAVVAVLCPGYLRWPKDFDPGALSVLPILPYAVMVLAILKKPKFTPGLAVALLVLTLALVSLNWTAAWVCGPLVFLLWGMRGLNRRGVFFLVAVMAVGIPAIAGVSVAAKYGSDALGGGSAKSGHVLGNYMWGHFGYGADLTTGRAFLRMAFANSIGLFPLWLVFLYGIWRRVRNGWGLSWIMFAPVAMAAADLVIMRNYFGHHPWMAGPVLIVGIIFSLALLRTPPAGETNERAEKIPFGLIPPIALAGFVYGVGVLLFLRANETELLSLTQLVRQHTARSDIIAVEKSDVATAGQADRLEEQLDRRVMVVDDVQNLAVAQGHCVILSATKLDDSYVLAAQSEVESQGVLSRAADWFNHTIAKRPPGDRLELSDTYFLYEPGH